MSNKFLAEIKGESKVLRGPVLFDKPLFSITHYDPVADFRIYRQNLARWVMYEKQVTSLPTIKAEWLTDSDNGRLLELNVHFKWEVAALDSEEFVIAVPIDKQALPLPEAKPYAKVFVDMIDHDKIVLTNGSGDTYTSKSEELMDFFHGQSIQWQTNKPQEDKQDSNEHDYKSDWEYHCKVSGGHTYETFLELCLDDPEFKEIWCSKKPDKQEGKPERMFTLKEALEIFVAGAQYSLDQFDTQNRQQYFKETFNIDL